MSTIQETYQQLQQQYDLPDFESMDKEFELSTLDSEKFLLRSIIQKIIDRLDFYCSLIESTLQPDTANLYAMHECKVLDESQKTTLYGLYRRFMSLNRQSIVVALTREEEKEAEYIKQFLKVWNENKEELLGFVSKLKQSWNEEKAIQEELEYLG